MTAKERDRLKVLHEVRKRHITQKQAAVELGLSVRWVRALQLRWLDRKVWYLDRKVWFQDRFWDFYPTDRPPG